MHTLIRFLREKMSMNEVYQPVIIRELLSAGGLQTQDKLARLLVEFDAPVFRYYKEILMRYPKTTLVSTAWSNTRSAQKAFAW